MKALKSSISRALQVGARMAACDNSGAKIVKIISVKGHKTTKGRRQEAGIADLVNVSVVTGKPDMRKQVVHAVVVRQKKPFRRADGTRVKFQDNAVVILKDEKGTPKGTIFKGPVAKEAAARWPEISKVASIVV